MSTVIKVTGLNSKRMEALPSIERVKKFLPQSLCKEIDEVAHAIGSEPSKNGSAIEEIRIRSDRRAYLTVGGRGIKHNLLLSTALSSQEVSDILSRMCDGSLYAYGESIVKGFITLEGGIRVGICGRASVEGKKILGIYNVSALNVRLPCRGVSLSPELVRVVRDSVSHGEGVLIYSPPAQGKTTLLRSLACALAGGLSPMRVAVVDTREELGGALQGGELCVDVLSGYPQAEGIRIATAFMNPQVIVCDEIGSEEDAMAIAQAQNCGVPLIASAHGGSAQSVLRRSGMRFLHSAGAFGIYIGIRISSHNGFEYELLKREEACLADSGDSGASD